MPTLRTVATARAAAVARAVTSTHTPPPSPLDSTPRRRAPDLRLCTLTPTLRLYAAPLRTCTRTRAFTPTLRRAAARPRLSTLRRAAAHYIHGASAPTPRLYAAPLCALALTLRRAAARSTYTAPLRPRLDLRRTHDLTYAAPLCARPLPVLGQLHSPYCPHFVRAPCA